MDTVLNILMSKDSKSDVKQPEEVKKSTENVEVTDQSGVSMNEITTEKTGHNTEEVRPVDNVEVVEVRPVDNVEVVEVKPVDNVEVIDHSGVAMKEKPTEKPAAKLEDIRKKTTSSDADEPTSKKLPVLSPQSQTKTDAKNQQSSSTSETEEANPYIKKDDFTAFIDGP